MSTSPFLAPIERLDPFVLSVANPFFRQDVSIEFIAVVSADEDFDVYLNKAGKPFPMSANDFFKMPVDSHGEQTKITFIEFRRKPGAAVANNTVTVILGNGDFRRGSFSVSATAVTIPKGFTAVTGNQVNVAAGAASVLFTATAKTLVTIRNDDAAVSLGVSTSAADLGTSWDKSLKIGPGEAAELIVEAGTVLRARHAGGAAVSVNVAAAVY